MTSINFLVSFQMLQCIIGMVDKTKRAVSVLQTRCSQDREELLAWARKTAEETEAEVKRRAGLLLFIYVYIVVNSSTFMMTSKLAFNLSCKEDTSMYCCPLISNNIL